MKKLLVVIDYQKDFVDGALGFKKAEILEEGIYNKAKKYLENEDKVVFTYYTNKLYFIYVISDINNHFKHILWRNSKSFFIIMKCIFHIFKFF